MQTNENIKRLREAIGMSQEELAFKVGYKDRSSIAKVETGNVDLPESKIAAFASALHVTTAELMGLHDPYSTGELIEEYMRGAKTWATDSRFTDSQKQRIKEYLTDSALKLKQVVNAMAECNQLDGKIISSDELEAILEDISHWTGNALRYVNKDFSDDPFSEENIRAQYLEAIKKLPRREQVAWLIRIQDHIENETEG